MFFLGLTVQDIPIATMVVLKTTMDMLGSTMVLLKATMVVPGNAGDVPTPSMQMP